VHERRDASALRFELQRLLGSRCNRARTGWLVFYDFDQRWRRRIRIETRQASHFLRGINVDRVLLQRAVADGLEHDAAFDRALSELSRQVLGPIAECGVPVHVASDGGDGGTTAVAPLLCCGRDGTWRRRVQ
jgi:hypothetical protein